jgi:hypothetical protein
MASSSSGGVVGTPCHYEDDDSPCGDNLFCQAPGCAAGTCQAPLGPGQGDSQLDPACGCDGVTYYNTDVAKVFRMSLRAAGPCHNAGAVKCGNTQPCIGGRRCNRQVPGPAECIDPAKVKGTCWALPAQCPNQKAEAVACGFAKACDAHCTLISTEQPWQEAVWCL